jgi:transposase
MFVAFDLEQFVPAEHPLRKIKRWADGVLADMGRDFNRAYGTTGRPGIPPERLIKALLLQALYSIPSQTRLVDAIQYNLLYRWFLDLPLA